MRIYKDSLGYGTPWIEIDEARGYIYVNDECISKIHHSYELKDDRIYKYSGGTYRPYWKLTKNRNVIYISNYNYTNLIEWVIKDDYLIRWSDYSESGFSSVSGYIKGDTGFVHIPSENLNPGADIDPNQISGYDPVTHRIKPTGKGPILGDSHLESIMAIFSLGVPFFTFFRVWMHTHPNGFVWSLAVHIMWYIGLAIIGTVGEAISKNVKQKNEDWKRKEDVIASISLGIYSLILLLYSLSL